MLLICLNRASETQSAIQESGRFVVNVLAEGQEAIAMRFATKSATKFEDHEIARTSDGLPLFEDALAHMTCSVKETASGGTHTVFLSEVEHAAAGEGSPLTYYRGKFGRFEDLIEESAYRQIRSLVIRRELPVGGPFTVELLAGAMGVEPQRVLYALTKLSSEGLVTREGDGRYAIRPLDVRLADQALEACCAIQTSVVDALVPKGLSETTLHQLREHVDACVSAVACDPPDLHALRIASGRFQDAFVSMTGNDLLIDAYRRLGMEGIWLRALGRRYIDPHYLVELLEACEARDAEAAKRALIGYTVEAREVANAAIARAGGSL